jgi:gluconokinase
VIVLVAGVSGSGKSTIGSLLASQLGCPFEDGDALHPAANIAKMRSGIPLTDSDRMPWLAAVAAWVDARDAAGGPGVIACSALKRRYREFLRQGRPGLRIVYLTVDRDILADRLAHRRGHFFRPELLDSQLADAEIPLPAERCLVVDADRTPGEVARAITRGLGLASYGEAGRR